MAASVVNIPRLIQMIITSHTQSAVKDAMQCNAQPCNNFAFAFQLMTVGLLNPAGFQNLKYQHQGIFRHLEALLYPTVLEISVFGVKPLFF